MYGTYITLTTPTYAVLYNIASLSNLLYSIQEKIWIVGADFQSARSGERALPIKYYLKSY